MSKKFVKGNVYVFSKKAFLRKEGKEEYLDNKCWIDNCNGLKVKTIFVNAGQVINKKCKYYVEAIWCKCIENNVAKPKGVKREKIKKSKRRKKNRG